MMSGATTGLESVKGVLLDTSYLMRLLKAEDPLSENAKVWLRELLDRKVPMYLSTIVVAEWALPCVPSLVLGPACAVRVVILMALAYSCSTCSRCTESRRSIS